MSKLIATVVVNGKEIKFDLIPVLLGQGKQHIKIPGHPALEIDTAAVVVELGDESVLVKHAKETAASAAKASGYQDWTKKQFKTELAKRENVTEAHIAQAGEDSKKLRELLQDSDNDTVIPIKKPAAKKAVS